MTVKVDQSKLQVQPIQEEETDFLGGEMGTYMRGGILGDNLWRLLSVVWMAMHQINIRPL